MGFLGGNHHFVSNSYLVKTKNLTNNQEAQLSQKLRDTDKVQNTSFISTQVEKQDSLSRSLQPVVLIFIVLSGTLAFVVLYNLTNINISERERELATIKVLGFFDNEVTMYIVREKCYLYYLWDISWLWNRKNVDMVHYNDGII